MKNLRFQFPLSLAFNIIFLLLCSAAHKKHKEVHDKIFVGQDGAFKPLSSDRFVPTHATSITRNNAISFTPKNHSEAVLCENQGGQCKFQRRDGASGNNVGIIPVVENRPITIAVTPHNQHRNTFRRDGAPPAPMGWGSVTMSMPPPKQNEGMDKVKVNQLLSAVSALKTKKMQKSELLLQVKELAQKKLLLGFAAWILKTLKKSLFGMAVIAVEIAALPFILTMLLSPFLMMIISTQNQILSTLNSLNQFFNTPQPITPAVKRYQDEIDRLNDTVVINAITSKETLFVH